MLPMSLGFNSSSTGKSGNATQGGSATGNGFNVNYGNGVSQGGGVPGFVLIGAAILAAVWAWKRFR